MEKLRVIGTIVFVRNPELKKMCANKNVVKKTVLPPLSMESYVYTGRKLQKKQKQVHSTIREAEQLMLLEFGHPTHKKKIHIGGKTAW